MSGSATQDGTRHGGGGASRVDGVLLDIDDTLVDTRGAFGAALEGILERYLPGAASRRDEVLAFWRADADGYYQRYTRGEVGYREQRMARANALHAHFGGEPLDAAAYDAWDELFEEGFSAAWACHPEVLDTLGAFRAAGIVVGALSNAAVAYQATKLGRAGLADHVPMLVGVDTLGVGKPDPAVFLEGCRRLGTEPSRTAYVGDELDVDARAAVAAGLVGVWVDRPGPRRVEVPEADVRAARAEGVEVVSSLDEVPALLVGGDLPVGGR